MIGSLLVGALVGWIWYATIHESRAAAEYLSPPPVACCALCGARGLSQRWLAWHHEATHQGEEVA